MAAKPSPQLSLEEVRKVARLACLRLTDEQAEGSRADLSAVLGYVQSLQSLPLEGVEPMTRPVESVNRFADDIPAPALPNEALLAIAPDTQDGFLRVPKVLGDGGGA